MVTVGAVVAFAVFRGLNRDDLEVKPQRIDYLAIVEDIQAGGHHVPYPEGLPDGWICRGAEYSPPPDPVWDLDLLTGSERYVGVHWERSSAAVLIERYVGDEAEPGAAVTVAGAQWASYRDPGGDYALVKQTGGETLLVYGSAPPDQVREVAESLVETPVDDS